MKNTTREIELRGPKGAGLVALVDVEDFDRVAAAGPWYPLEKPHGIYARRTGKAGAFNFMHNVVMGLVGIDHINHNTLDNRKCNLRPATAAQNGANQKKSRSYKGRQTSSQFKGVVLWINSCGTVRWRARIVVGGKTLSLGCFDSEIEAAQAYNEAAELYFGQFAYTNAISASHSDLRSPPGETPSTSHPCVATPGVA